MSPGPTSPRTPPQKQQHLQALEPKGPHMSLRTGLFPAVALAVAGLLLTGCAGAGGEAAPGARRDPRGRRLVGFCRAPRPPDADGPVAGDPLPRPPDPRQDLQGDPAGGRGGRRGTRLQPVRRHALRAHPRPGLEGRVRSLARAQRPARLDRRPRRRATSARRSASSASPTRAASCPTRAPGSRTTSSRRFDARGTGFEGEPLRGSFDYVVAINYNREPGTTPLDRTRPLGDEKGGGIWIHVDHGGPTQGCVSLPRTG